jgi:uncharacterized protein (DUF1778 family)
LEIVVYNYGMGRPIKKDALRMDKDIRVPVTADQKKIIEKAVANEPQGMAAWVRQVVLKAAEEKINRGKE